MYSSFLVSLTQKNSNSWTNPVDLYNILHSEQYNS